MAIRPRSLEDVAVNARFWRGRRVLITGHTGFKGAWLSFWLERLGAKITGYGLPAPTRPSFFEAALRGLRVRSVNADIRDLRRLKREFRRAKPEVVFHLAAQSLVRESYRAPLQTYSTNVIGTAHLLECLREVPARAVVVVSSDKCYAEKPGRAYRETDRLGGWDPYSSSKACAEHVLSAYAHSFFNGGSLSRRAVGLVSARSGNVIGGGDWARDRLVPDCLRAIRSGKRMRVRYPQAVRPWQHVLEPLRGYLLLAERAYQDPRRFSGAWNFGPKKESFRTVREVLAKIARMWGTSGWWEPQAGEHPHEAPVLKLDSVKASSQLGWRPVWDLDEALAKTVAWYRGYYGRADMARLTAAQLEEFEKKARP